MSYTALYRKFRPTTFDDVKGQDHIVTTLRNQIKAGRIGHAFLFCGTRGTGKTTSAQILAKAVNCEAPVDGNPCGVCPMCRSIAAGTSMNVIEIDAASNNGVDNIREIVEEVRYSPTEGKYKVYIIDEVHMLSAGAFNALLKTLEEPPSYVIFILATTEVHKIPITILSRCQRYDFRRITVEEIAARLKELTTAEQIEAEDKALRYVATAADGSLRDGISLLDQCIAFYLGEKLTYDKVLEVLGTVDVSVFGRLMRNIRTGDVNGCLRLLEEIVARGRELTQFTVDFTWYLRNLLLAKASEELIETLEIPSDYMQEFLDEVHANEEETLVRYIRVVSELTNNIRYASQKRVLVEVALIKLCRPQMETGFDALIERVSKLEESVQNGVVFPSSVPLSGAGTAGEMPAEQIQPSAPLPKALAEDIAEVAKNWGSISSKLPGAIKMPVGSARPSVGSNNEFLLVFTEGFDRDFINQPEHLEEIKKTIAAEIGKEVEVSTVLAANHKESSLYPDITQIVTKVPIEFVD
ncbi:MAG: DNA polymerase III subunit gamma/tau [Lachnospiraceae bacterium]